MGRDPHPHPDGGGGPPIPKVIHRIWIGGPEPRWMRRYAHTWAEHHPGWQVMQWDDDTIADLQPFANQDVWDRAEAIAGDRVGQLRADVARYEILWRFGGLYVDADFYCLQPVDRVLAHDRTTATFERQGRWVANGLMSAPAGDRFIRRLIDGIPNRVRRLSGPPAVLTGPRYITGLWRRHPDELRVLPEAWFYPYGHSDVADHPLDETFDDPDLVAVHVWHNQRRHRGLL